MTNRELDARVAEKVMGWTYFKSKHGHWVVRRPDGETIEPYFGAPLFNSFSGEKYPEREWHDGADVPDYSTNIADAWDVVAIIGEDFYLRLNSPCTGCNVKTSSWECGRVIPGDSGHSEQEMLGEAETAPRAICLAALKAVGVEVPA